MAVASTYPSLLDCLLEQVQNALDALAKNILVRINMGRRRISVEDDGQGVTESQFDSALTSVNQTIKSADKLGRFGRGMVSPLGKCEEFTFTSCGQRHMLDGYKMWTFNTKQIETTVSDLHILMQQGMPMIFSRTQAGSKYVGGVKASYVPWRTRVSMYGITEDRVISKLTPEELKEAIAERYRATILGRGVNVEIDFTDLDGRNSKHAVEAVRFSGRQLPEVKYHLKASGDVVFKLYVSRKTLQGTYRGKVLVGELDNDFRITMRQLANSTDGIIDKETAQALQGGVFEGEILGKKISLHPDRKRFEPNDALLDFLVCLRTWFEEVGLKELDEARSEVRDERYQALGLRSMRAIEEMLRQPQWQSIYDLFKVGTIGAHHTENPSQRARPFKEKSTGGGSGSSKEEGSNPSSNGSSGHPKERMGHHSTTVAGPQGKRRPVARGTSTGLTFMNDSLPTRKVYEFDRTQGLLCFNNRHPYWAECESRDTALMRYMESVAIIALALVQQEGSEHYDHQCLMMEEVLGMQVFHILHADRLTNRRRGTSSASKRS